MEKEKFEQLINEGLKLIPKDFLAKLENVAIVVEEEPNQEQLQKARVGVNSTLLGLYEGVPQTKRGPNYGLTLPDKITIFQGPIERDASTDEEIKKIVCDTVWHEIAHHFGSGEAGARRAAAKVKKR